LSGKPQSSSSNNFPRCQCAETPLALKALQQMRFWNLSPFDLKFVRHGIMGQFAEKLLRVGLLPEGEFNDGLILAETAFAGIPVLATSATDLLDIEEAANRLLLVGPSDWLAVPFETEALRSPITGLLHKPGVTVERFPLAVFAGCG
jgi:hypothetical protein